MKNTKTRLKIFLVIFALFFVSFSFYFYQIFFTPNFLIQHKKDGPPVVLLIPTGGTIQSVRDSIEKMKILGDKQSFYFLTRLMGYNDKVRPGRYLIYPQSFNLQVIKKLKRGEQDPLELKINNIRLKKDLAQRLDTYLEPGARVFDSLMRDSAFVAQYGFDTTTIMSMFIPNTYEFYWNVTPKKFFDRMHKNYNEFWNETRKAKAAKLGLTPVQVSTLASIVEAETNQNSEKTRIAGVYLNRLKKDMLLQADPTVKFAVGDFTLKRVWEIHTQKDSPYNTYMYKGLPPGPINLPSITSMEAVLNAEQHDYIYFCASPNAPGFHDFAVTYNDHINNANNYHKSLNKRKIK